MRLLSGARLAGQMVSVLRQELDSMIRVIYLLSQNTDRRNQLIDAAANGEKWSQAGSRAKVTDKEMVDLAQSLQGWTQSVYKFGCAFIHLSGLHDYNDRDPLAQLPVEERENILENVVTSCNMTFLARHAAMARACPHERKTTMKRKAAPPET